METTENIKYIINGGNMKLFNKIPTVVFLIIILVLEFLIFYFNPVEVEAYTNNVYITQEANYEM